MRKLFSFVLTVSAVGLFAVGGFSLGFSQVHAQEAAARTVRPEIDKVVQATVEAIKAKRGKEALEKLAEADAVKDKTPFEDFVLERLRGQAAALTDDFVVSARAFERAALSSAGADADKRQLMGAAAGQYYAAKDYAKALELATRYFKEGGSDRAVRTIYIQTLYLGGDFGRAAKEMLADIQALESEGKRPTEVDLQLLANASLKQGDQAGYGLALEKLITYFPKRDYWFSAVQRATSRLPERLSLDAARLKLATDALRSADDYALAAQLAVQAGLPLEAKKFVDAGYAANLLGTGAAADRHRRLKELVAKNVAEDKRTLGLDDAQVIANKDGTPQFNAGFNYILHERADKGLEMMEQGWRKGVKRPDEASLHLAYAYYLAGQKTKAVQAFKAIPASDPAAALARLWALRAAQE